MLRPNRLWPLFDACFSGTASERHNKENMMRAFSALAVSAALTMTLGGCASSGSMNAGERIAQRGGEIAQYGDAWTSGKKEVRDGERLDAKSASRIEDAQKKLAQAESDQAKARQMIADGKIKMQRAEADYAAARAGPPATNIPQ